METIVLNDVVNNTSLNSEGYGLFARLEIYLINKRPVVLDLRLASAISSSFFNSSFGALIEKYGYSRFKECVKFINVSKSQAQLLKLYFDSFRNLETN